MRQVIDHNKIARLLTTLLASHAVIGVLYYIFVALEEVIDTLANHG
jgi:hypothetical protein